MESLQNHRQHLKSTPSDNPNQRMRGQFPDGRTTSFLHPSLLGSHDIRLLHLLPGSFDQDIHCEISVHDSSLPLTYNAVSYTWADETGSDDLCKTLFVSGQPLSITRNCENALKRIRMLDHTWFIWIDAVCINQNDISERNRQVQLMSRIYSGSRRVLVYIGEAADNTSFCLYSLGKLSLLADKRVSRQQQSDSKALSSKDDIHKAYVGWKDLLQRPYWSRAWVMQEFALAQKVTVICGDKKFSPRLLLQGRRWEEFITDASEIPGLSFLQLPGLSFMNRKDFQFQPTRYIFVLRRLLDLLDALRSSQAKDPRDKVYAILGLVMDDSNRGLCADYNLDVKDLYVRVAIKLAVDYGWEDVLRRAGTKHRAIDALPSWAPDWSCPIKDSPDLSNLVISPVFPRYDEIDSSLNFPACRIGLEQTERVYLFHTTGSNKSQRDDGQAGILQRLCLSNPIMAGMRNWPGMAKLKLFAIKSCARLTTQLCLDLSGDESTGNQLVNALHTPDRDRQQYYLIPVHDIVAAVLVTTAKDVFTMLRSIYNTFLYRMGDPWCRLLRYTRKRALHSIPNEVILGVIAHEMRPPNEVDSLWQDTVALDPSTEAKLKAAEEYQDSEGVLVRPNDYQLLLKLNDAIWKLLVRLFTFTELDVKII
ncbi:HET-domain-containing protein [Xylaria arbuscula]|nr:HET-domain-containing protein [Xylaria arbuscula]